MKIYQIILLLTIAAALILVMTQACNQHKKNDQNIDSLDITNSGVVESTKYATIYEVNLRQYTPEGTFKAFEEHLPRLKKMGIKIIWLMPIHPIGELKRKGTLGSYYAVKDYYGINPEFGNQEDLRSLIKKIHENEMLVILDWVANHTAWDHPWAKHHTNWYTKDTDGSIVSPVADWTDVADLNYNNDTLQEEMISAMVYWVKQFNVDGFRCDVAGMVPTDFWRKARKELEKVKPVFMLAEAEMPEHHPVIFDANYAWNLHHIMNDIAAGKKKANDLKAYFKKDSTEYGKGVYRMIFTSNHDENSWNGTVFERMPDSYEAFAVFSFLVPGMPLIYSGQEAGLDKRLDFFEKDTITWKAHPMNDLYIKLIALKKQEEALWNGNYGGDMVTLKTSEPEKVFAFIRNKDNSSVLSVFNFSREDVTFKIRNPNTEKWTDYFNNKSIDLSGKIELAPWEYKIGLPLN